MSNEEIIQYLTNDDVIVFNEPAYEGALIGVSLDGQAIYDYSRMVQSLINEGMDEESAADFINYNYSYNPKGDYPIIIMSIIDWEDK